MTPLISVIVPVYNVKNMVGKCISSIINQSYKKIEIIIVDDGSSDGSAEICDDFLNIDNRIKVFHKQNGGLSDARNFGIERASGEFYLFIDSDDLIHEDFCKVLIEAQQKYDADIVSSGIIKFYRYEELKIYENQNFKINYKILEGDNILKQYFCPENDEYFINHGLCMKLYSKSLFRELRFSVGRLHEDLYITYLLLDLSKRIVLTDAPYYYYYQKNENSITKNYTIKNFNDEYDALFNMIEYFKDKNSIKKELDFFIIYHYLYLLQRLSYIKSNPGIKSKRRALKKQIRERVIKYEAFSLLKKLRICIGICNIRVYAALGEARNRLRNKDNNT